MMAIRTVRSHARQFSKFRPLRQWHTGHTGSLRAHVAHRLEPCSRVRFPQSLHIGRAHAGSRLAIINLHPCHEPGGKIAHRSTRFHTIRSILRAFVPLIHGRDVRPFQTQLGHSLRDDALFILKGPKDHSAIQLAEECAMGEAMADFLLRESVELIGRDGA